MPKLVGAAVCKGARERASFRSHRWNDGRDTPSTSTRSIRRRAVTIAPSTFARFDTSGTGQLELPELRTFLQTLAPEGVPLTDDELVFVMHRGDKSGSGGLDISELRAAAALWQSYCDAKPRVCELFERYDTDRSGRLDRLQLLELLKDSDMVDGRAVTDAELDEVFSFADVVPDGLISQPELSLAIAKWFALRPSSSKKT